MDTGEKLSFDMNSRDAIKFINSLESKEGISDFLSEGEDRKSVLNAAAARIEKLEEPAPAPKPKAKAKPKEKEISPAEIVDDCVALEEKFAKFELQQKKAGKGFRHIIMARNRLKQLKMNFNHCYK